MKGFLKKKTLKFFFPPFSWGPPPFFPPLSPPCPSGPKKGKKGFWGPHFPGGPPHRSPLPPGAPGFTPLGADPPFSGKESLPPGFLRFWPFPDPYFPEKPGNYGARSPYPFPFPFLFF